MAAYAPGPRWASGSARSRSAVRSVLPATRTTAAAMVTAMVTRPTGTAAISPTGTTATRGTAATTARRQLRRITGRPTTARPPTIRIGDINRLGADPARDG